MAEWRWMGTIARASVRPALFLFVLFGGLFGWPFLLGSLLHGRDVGDGTGLALALAPMCLVPGLLIARFGHGRDIPSPGQYTVDDLPLYARYRRVYSLRGRQRVLALMSGLALMTAALGLVLRSPWAVIASLDVAALTFGITVGLARSTQRSGRGPLLKNRLGH